MSASIPTTYIVLFDNSNTQIIVGASLSVDRGGSGGSCEHLCACPELAFTMTAFNQHVQYYTPTFCDILQLVLGNTIDTTNTIDGATIEVLPVYFRQIICT